MPAFSHSFLKRRMALSMDSFSRTLTPVINNITPNPAGSPFEVVDCSLFNHQVKYFTAKIRSWRVKAVGFQCRKLQHHRNILHPTTPLHDYKICGRNSNSVMGDTAPGLLEAWRRLSRELGGFHSDDTRVLNQKLIYPKILGRRTFQDSPKQSLGLLTKRIFPCRGRC